MEKVELTIDEVLQKVIVFTFLFFKGRKLVDLSDSAWEEENNYMIYRELFIIKNLEGQRFVIGLGEKNIIYPGKGFSSNFLLMPIDEHIDDLSVIREVRGLRYFKNSLLTTSTDGVYISLYPKLSMEWLTGNVSNASVARVIKISQEEIVLSLNPMIKQPCLYGVDVVDYLTKAIIEHINNI